MPIFPVAPNAYAVGPVKGAPSYSLAARAQEMKKFVTPAPGNYEVQIPLNYQKA